ncbi:hypothetical protein EVAR_70483_1 [Eumeta japonica]|uniref:Uncharacterized protein n=1 Tax=Eumeta variegata TaxID=151549 RepID=A0A4C1ZZ87_EUMVA|nr:hypothetical protein EVAR_70483_1 [Eumeta japonica]
MIYELPTAGTRPRAPGRPARPAAFSAAADGRAETNDRVTTAAALITIRVAPAAEPGWDIVESIKSS